MDLTAPVETLPRTRRQTIQRFHALGIVTLFDLLMHIPSRYIDLSVTSPIEAVQAGEQITIEGTVTSVKNRYTRNRLTIQELIITDETGSLSATWFNQPYILRVLPQGTRIALSGTIKQTGNRRSIEPLEYEKITKENRRIHTGRLIPVYPETRGLSSRTIREKIMYLIEELTAQNHVSTLEWLPETIRQENALMDLYEALKTIHNPRSQEEAAHARSRLAFDELFALQYKSALIRREWQQEVTSTLFSKAGWNSNSIKKFVKKLPFTLTRSQQKVCAEIFSDLKKKVPMNRFLQGDVGSGKTVVAAIAAYCAHLNGYQTLIMAPTEVLASQHYTSLSRLFENTTLTLAIHTGSVKMPNQTQKADIIIGTHAILNAALNTKRIGLVIIDEQHRFGVSQRAELKSKGIHPHLLTMTATPIPRTVALTLYRELDVSEITTMPKGRKPVKTFLVPHYKRTAAYAWITKKVYKTPEQAFIICPLIEESDHETMKSVRSAKAEYERLTSVVFPTLSLALLHGKLSAKEKETIMRRFAEGKYDILVSTSVVEVGIDIPTATIMLIEGAERFGLAQLHQLRGRVGRGDTQSYCLLFPTESSSLSKERLSFFAKTSSGLELAEYDLTLRGPGQIFGTKQHGYRELKIANITDLESVQKAKKAAEWCMHHLSPSRLTELSQKLRIEAAPPVARD